MTADGDHPLGAPRVRAARSDDAGAIAAIVVATGWLEDDEVTLRERCTGLIPDAEDLGRQLLVAELVGEIAGFVNVTWSHAVTLAGPEGYVTELFVHPDLRGRGVGSALLDAVETHARVLEATRLRVPTARFAEAYSRRFYERRGLEARTVVFERSLP